MIIIGEKINATRKSISQAIINRDSAAIQKQVSLQDQAGAQYIDLNAGTGAGDENQEIEDMNWMIDIALETTEKNLSIDSASPRVIEAAVSHLDGRRPFMINSVKNDPAILDVLLPISSAYNAPVISLAIDKDEIPDCAERRVQVCRDLYSRAMEVGVAEENILFDPLVMPISANWSLGGITLDTLRLIKQEFPQCKTSMGVSNISFGLPKRARINEALMLTAVTMGLDAAICDPTKPGTKKAILLGRLISARDRHCRGYNRAVRQGLFDPPTAKKNPPADPPAK